MLINKHEKEYKHALSLLKERNKLLKQKWSIKPIKLETPIQHGFVRSLEFRDEIKKRNDYQKIKETFNFLGQQPVYHPTEDFLVKTKKSIFEKHAVINTKMDPRFQFYWSEDKRKTDLTLLNLHIKYLSWHGQIYSCECPEHVLTKWRKTFKPHYCFKYPHWLQEITKPHFLTHYSPVDGELESRISEINSEMESKNYYNMFFSSRSVWDKIWNSRSMELKYNSDKNVIYHTLNFKEDEDS